jgi:hypothetical protein
VISQQDNYFFLIIAFYLKKVVALILVNAYLLAICDEFLGGWFCGILGYCLGILKKIQVRTDLLLMMRVNN